MSRTKVALVGQAVLELNNERRLRLSQTKPDGPILVHTLSAPYDIFGHRDVETEYEISASDFVMMLNWYRCQKAQGNDALMF